jgi:hypothetical protein
MFVWSYGQMDKVAKKHWATMPKWVAMLGGARDPDGHEDPDPSTVVRAATQMDQIEPKKCLIRVAALEMP